MRTRSAAFAVSSSFRAKQNLLRLLFSDGPTASYYSYNELRAAYLQRVQMLHPDKLVSSYGRSQQQQMQQQISLEEKKQATRRFVDLQQAWELYEKNTNKHSKANGSDASSPPASCFASSFTTLFGPSSFWHSEKERALREIIIQQACRGWFSAGAIENGIASSGVENATQSTLSQKKTAPLTDEVWFVPTQ